MSRYSVCIQASPLAAAAAQAWLADAPGAGAVVLFSGLVRDEGDQVRTLTLEHYPGMSERMLGELCEQVAARWPVSRVLAWHRVGAMTPADTIVLVGVAAAHRREAFEACDCLMDRVKTEVPLWKKLSGPGGDGWVEARDRDAEAAARWHPPEEDKR